MCEFTEQNLHSFEKALDSKHSRISKDLILRIPENETVKIPVKFPKKKDKFSILIQKPNVRNFPSNFDKQRISQRTKLFISHNFQIYMSRFITKFSRQISN